MSTNLILQVVRLFGEKVFRPSDIMGEEYLALLSEGTLIKAVCTKPRNPKFHRLAFGLLSYVFKHQKLWPTFDHFLDVMKDATGYFDIIHDGKGGTIKSYRSLSFSKMDDKAFGEWWGSAVEVILERIIPNVNKRDFEQEVYNFLGERGPHDY